MKANQVIKAVRMERVRIGRGWRIKVCHKQSGKIITLARYLQKPRLSKWLAAHRQGDFTLKPGRVRLTHAA